MADEEDSISTLPDEILQHILSFIPTELAVKASLLSRRWRHVWCDLPSLSFHAGTLEAATYCKTQNRYIAPKMMSLHLQTGSILNAPHIHINMWLELAMSRNVENLSLQFPFYSVEYNFPDFFYINSSVKELSIDVYFTRMMITNSSVSWTSLKKLSLRWYFLSDESIAKILTGCPILESLTLDFCHKLRSLDLSKSLRLRTLHLVRHFWVTEPMQIVGPHIHCLTIRNSQSLCTLVDVSSLTEAKLNMGFKESFQTFQSIEVMVQKMLEMLEKLKNVEKLAFGGDFLQILSFAELRGETFPMFKVKDLTIETSLFQFVIPPTIERLLQNSPDLKKLTILIRTCDIKTGEYLDTQLDLLGSDSSDQGSGLKDSVRWNMSRWSEETKQLASFMKLMLKNTRTLEKMVVRLEDRYLEARGFKELVRTLSHNTDISIVFSTKPTTLDKSW